MIPIALTIAGSDPSGGAGIQADLKTFHQHGVYGTAVVTLLTVQNTQKVARVVPVDASLVIEQLDAVLEDLPPAAAKTGALGTARTIEALAERADEFHFDLVVDPVMVSKHGTPLIDEPAQAVLAEALLPHAYLLTPNLREAEILTGMTIRDAQEMADAAVRLVEMGAENVLVKGGHLPDSELAIDVLYADGVVHRMESPRIDTRHTHGTGCVYSAAITANLAYGLDLVEAVEDAKRFITRAIQTNPGLGQGRGPLNMHAGVDEA